MVERYGPLICEEDFPFVELYDIVRRGGLCEESLGQCFGEGAARHGYFEGVVAVDARILALDDIGSEGAGEAVDVREGEKVWVSSHCDELWAFCGIFCAGWWGLFVAIGRELLTAATESD